LHENYFFSPSKVHFSATSSHTFLPLSQFCSYPILSASSAGPVYINSPTEVFCQKQNQELGACSIAGSRGLFM